MKKILLMGNPNVGKSVVFSRLTGANVITSNYPGTTIDFSEGYMRIAGERHMVIDVPGTYSLEPSCRAEEVATRIMPDGDLIINVVDATNLERNLYLTLELLEQDTPVIVALNLWDETKHMGIDIDVRRLEELLDVPVVPTVALTGEGIQDLVQRISEATSPRLHAHTPDERWSDIGKIIHEVQHVEHRHHKLRERLAEVTIKPLTGIPIALAIILLSFWIVREIGEGLIAYIFEPLFELYRPLAMNIATSLGPGWMRDILVGKLINGEIDYIQSMGVLTTALYVPFGAVLPYIVAFYLVLSILEDTGYLPRLATLVDNVFHRLGMHGHGIITVFLGLGCNVPGALSTRIMETRKQRFIAATLLGLATPCMAQTAMIFGILGQYGLRHILIVFITLFLLYITAGLILNRIVRGESPEIFMEIPPYRTPSATALLKKTWMRIRWFLAEAVPWLFFGIILVNILFAIGFIDLLGWVFAPIMEGWLGLPRAATAAMLIGFMRKDLAVGMLLPLGMTPMQLVIAATLLTIYFPCVATFVTLLKELGPMDMGKATLIMIIASLLVGGLMRIILIGA